MVMTDLLRELGAGSDDVARVTRTLLEQSNQEGYADAWQVAGRANVPFADLVDILQSLHKHGLIEYRRSEMRLTAEGEAFARFLHTARTESVTCGTCGGSGFEFEPFHQAYEEFLPLLAKRPPAEATYDQG